MGIIVLIMLCIFGAFLGAERAGAFFNSPPMTVIWAVLLLLLIAAIVTYAGRLSNPSLLLLHMGPIFLLIGAGLDSDWSYKLQKKFSDVVRPKEGTMILYPGQDSARLIDRNTGEFAPLGFRVKLLKFTVEYYPGSGLVRDYISQVEIIEEEQVIRRAAIEVNKPLHYGGYHLYQYAWGNINGEYTVLKAVSDNGLGYVYGGYVLTSIGVFWRCWGRLMQTKGKPCR